MVYRFFTFSTIVLLLNACISAPQYNPPPATTYMGTSVTNISKGTMVGWAEDMQKCNDAFSSGKLKTHYARGLCMDKAIERYIASYYVNQAALRDARSQVLLNMIQIDKKQLTPEEAGLLNERVMNKALEEEMASEREIAQSNLASQQMAAQQENARNIALLNALKQPFDAQRQWVDQQNRSIINCYSSGGMTGCRQGY